MKVLDKVNDFKHKYSGKMEKSQYDRKHKYLLGKQFITHMDD